MQNSDTAIKKDNASLVSSVLDTFLAAKQEQAQTLHPHYAELWDEISRLIQSGGKRLRSRMVLLSYGMFGGKDPQGVAPAAAAQELLHLGMLIHDDIIDRDYVRYGVNNIAGGYLHKYQPFLDDAADRRHFAQSASILAGDLLLSESYRLMATSKVSAETILSIQELLSQGVYEVIGGELIDTELAFRTDAIITAETVARHKTASYTFILPMMVGARLAGATATDQAHLRDFCQHLGIAFQFRDDIIGVFGNEAETGKTTIGDIREGKRTYMVEQFYELATQVQKDEFERYFGNVSVTPEQAEIVRQLLIDSGARAHTEAAIVQYEAHARAALSSLVVNPAHQAELETLIIVATTRKK